MTHRFDAWVGCVVMALGACGTPDNGGTEISFGPVSVSTTLPGTIGDGSLACPSVAGCFWYADPEGGGFCLGNGFG